MKGRAKGRERTGEEKCERMGEGKGKGQTNRRERTGEEKGNEPAGKGKGIERWMGRMGKKERLRQGKWREGK